MDCMNLLLSIVAIIFGGISAYYKANNKLRQKTVEFIAFAEELYKDSTDCGSKKFNFVIGKLYNQIPTPLKLFITPRMLEDIIQTVFDSIEKYARIQLDKIVDEAENAENIKKSQNAENTLDKEKQNK